MRYASVALLALMTALPPSFAAAQERVQYLLGPQDRLMIRVHSLRRSTGEAYAWAPLNGEFAVGADGNLSMPVIGALRAEGRTTAELAERISETLKEIVNLAEAPSAAVEVLTYRPFFIMGAVEMPGRYEFQPGMTVLQAVSTAQGLARANDPAELERDIVIAGGELRVLDAERIALEARMARLEAEVAGAEGISFPVEFLARRNDPRVAAAMREEEMKFTAHLDRLAAEISAVDRSIALLEEEMGSLEEKSFTLDRQLDVTGQEMGLTNELRDRGLAVASRQFQVENSQLAVQSSMLDLQVANLRAQQSLSQANRDSIDIRSRYHQTALDDLVSTRTLLAQNTERRRTSEQLMQSSLARAPGALSETDGVVAVYRLTRIGESGPVTSEVAADAVLQAGDVLEVSVRRSGQDLLAPGQ